MPFATRRAALAASGALLATPALAQPAWPSRPITILVPNPPGGGTDFTARLYAEALSQSLGQTVVIENRPGANGNIAIGAAARAAPDGHTLLLQYSGYHAGNPAMIANLTWDPIRDFVLVGMGMVSPHAIITSPAVPATNLLDFIAWVRARPGQANYASSGSGTIQHIAGALFARAIGTDIVHVPYRGAAPALQDVAGGRVEMFITTPASAVGLVQGGRVRALAITSNERSAALPDVPTTAEAGLPGFTIDAWFAFAAPSGVPRPVQERLNAEFRRLAATPAIRQRAQEGGAATRPMTLEELDTLARQEIRDLGAVIRSANITIE